MEARFCQSCGMPLQKNEELGTNHDGSKNEEYCCYCYKDGAFTMNCTISFRKKRLSVLRPAGLGFLLEEVHFYLNGIFLNGAAPIAYYLSVVQDNRIESAESIERFWMMF